MESVEPLLRAHDGDNVPVTLQRAIIVENLRNSLDILANNVDLLWRLTRSFKRRLNLCEQNEGRTISDY